MPFPATLALLITLLTKKKKPQTNLSVLQNADSLLPWSQITIGTIGDICIFRLKLLLFSQHTDLTERNYSFLLENTTKFRVSIRATPLNTQTRRNGLIANGIGNCHLQSYLLWLGGGWSSHQRGLRTAARGSEDSCPHTVLPQQAWLGTGWIGKAGKLRLNGSITSYFSITAPAGGCGYPPP